MKKSTRVLEKTGKPGLTWFTGSYALDCYLVFFVNFWTILTICRHARSLKLWDEVPRNKFHTSLPQKLVTKDES